MVAAASGPVMLATAATVGPGWWLGLVPALVLLAVIALDLMSGPRLRQPLPDETSTTDDGPLPRRYWLAWGFLVAAVAAEFSIVFWAATLVERRTGVSTAEATLVGALFLAGMFAGRLVLSAGVGAARDVRQLVAGGLVLAAIGSTLVWVSTSAPLSGAALFLAGAGSRVSTRSGSRPRSPRRRAGWPSRAPGSTSPPGWPSSSPRSRSARSPTARAWWSAGDSSSASWSSRRDWRGVSRRYPVTRPCLPSGRRHPADRADRRPARRASQ